VSPGWLLLVVTYLLVAPGILVLGPLAGLLLVARPFHQPDHRPPIT
jgi:hypothetical protein